jgi:ribosome-binding protein aMBF1 (putative translation factor)
MDALVAQAKIAHTKSCYHTDLAGHFRQQRDRLIRQAYDTRQYSYSQLARLIGISPELVAKIVQGRSSNL